MVKKISLLLSLILLISCFTACSAEPPKPELTEKDYEYIDSVYNSMSSWDGIRQLGGQEYTIDKISFFDFNGSGKLTFFVNFPYGAYYGIGYYVTTNGIAGIEDDVYDIDTNQRFDSCVANNSYQGTAWDYEATDEEKYETIKTAYLTYLEKQ